MEEQDDFHFLFIATLSLAASILKDSFTSSTGVSSFFFFTPGAFFFNRLFTGFRRSFSGLIWV